jgi:hypothetical protein
MRYTAFAAIVIGVLAGGFAGYQYGNGVLPGGAENPSTASLVKSLVLAALVVVVGAFLWVFPRVGYTGLKGTPVGLLVRDTKARRWLSGSSKR